MPIPDGGLEALNPGVRQLWGQTGLPEPKTQGSESCRSGDIARVSGGVIRTRCPRTPRQDFSASARAV